MHQHTCCNYLTAKLYVNVRDNTQRQILWITCCLGLVCLLFFWWNKTCWWYVESTRPRESWARRAWKDKNQQLDMSGVKKEDMHPKFNTVQHRACCCCWAKAVDQHAFVRLSSWSPMLPGSFCMTTAVLRECFLVNAVCGQRSDEAHHMLHRIWKRIRFCLCRIGMTMRKTAIRRQRKNTMVWTIMPAGERSEPQGLIALQNVQHPTNLHATPAPPLHHREGRGEQ